MHDVRNRILNQIGGRKNLTSSLFSAYSKKLCGLIKFLWTILCRSLSCKKTLSPGCKMSLWHSLRCRPRLMWQEMSFRTPDPLSAFRGLGTRLPQNHCVDLSEGEVIYLTFDWLKLYIQFCMSSVIVYKWKVVILFVGVQCSLQSLIMTSTCTFTVAITGSL